MIEHYIFWAAVAAINAVYDGMRWRRGDYIPQSGHFSRSTIRFVLFAFNASWAIDFEPMRSIEIMPLLLGQFFAFWLVFDLAINIIAGKRAFHLGHTSLFDRLFWVIAGWEYAPAIAMQYACKIAGVLVSWLWWESI